MEAWRGGKLQSISLTSNTVPELLASLDVPLEKAGPGAYNLYEHGLSVLLSSRTCFESLGMAPTAQGGSDSAPRRAVEVEQICRLGLKPSVRH